MPWKYNLLPLLQYNIILKGGHQHSTHELEPNTIVLALYESCGLTNKAGTTFVQDLYHLFPNCPMVPNLLGRGRKAVLENTGVFKMLREQSI